MCEGAPEAADCFVARASRPCIRAQAELSKNASLLRMGETPMPLSIERSPRNGRAFTLVELLVVIGIIALLVGITLPAIIKARIRGAQTAQKIEFEAISTGLEAYKNDQGEYPPVTYQDSGAEVLGRALIAPGPAVAVAGTSPFDVNQFAGLFPGPYFVCIHATSNSPATGDPNWQELTIPYADLNDGPGFRIRQQGKVFGPYLDATKFRTRGLQILDHWNNPVLYFPANPSKPNIRIVSSPPYVLGNLATYPYIGQMPTVADIGNNNNVYNGAHKTQFLSLFDAGDNISAFIRGGESMTSLPPVNNPVVSNAYKRMATLLGDYNPGNPTSAKNWDGLIDDPAEPAVSTNYVLWSAGPDGFYGITSTTPTASEIQKCDDVTNVAP
jgi:prepilin-type N-terminal cleavage/methylation domain-containing protein